MEEGRNGSSSSSPCAVVVDETALVPVIMDVLSQVLSVDSDVQVRRLIVILTVMNATQYIHFFVHFYFLLS